MGALGRGHLFAVLRSFASVEAHRRHQYSALGTGLAIIVTACPVPGLVLDSLFHLGVTAQGIF